MMRQLVTIKANLVGRTNPNGTLQRETKPRRAARCPSRGDLPRRKGRRNYHSNPKTANLADAWKMSVQGSANEVIRPMRG
jgi:hypothetical protein